MKRVIKMLGPEGLRIEEESPPEWWFNDLMDPPPCEEHQDRVMRNHRDRVYLSRLCCDVFARERYALLGRIAEPILRRQSREDPAIVLGTRVDLFWQDSQRMAIDICLTLDPPRLTRFAELLDEAIGEMRPLLGKSSSIVFHSGHEAAVAFRAVIGDWLARLCESEANKIITP